MNDATPGFHPPQDVLADLVAEALPLDQAREVEAHVMACLRCERLLADAERVRSLLSAPDPGPMPDDVWARVESGLVTESAHQTRAIPVPPPAMSFDEAPTAAWKAFLSDPAEPSPEPAPRAAAPEPAPRAAAPEPHRRVGRAVRSMRSRRDVRAEVSSSRRPRPWVLAGAAAAGVAVLGVGGWVTISLIGEGHTDAVVTDLPGAGARGVMHASGAEYTASTLAEQTKALVRTGSPAGATPVARATTVPSRPGTVSDPLQLTSCLRALGEGDSAPIAVDLARYQGREAAVMVLAGKNGGLDVWVVARGCRPGAEGTLAYKTVPG